MATVGRSAIAMRPLEREAGLQIGYLTGLSRLTLRDLYKNEKPDEGHARVLEAFKHEFAYDVIMANIDLAVPSGNFFCLCEIGNAGRRLHALFWMYKLAQAEK